MGKKKGILVLWQRCQNVNSPCLNRSWYFCLCSAFTINIFAATEITLITCLSAPYGVSFVSVFAAKKKKKGKKDGKFGKVLEFWQDVTKSRKQKSESFRSPSPSLPQWFWFLDRTMRFHFRLQLSRTINSWLRQIGRLLRPRCQTEKWHLPWLSPKTAPTLNQTHPCIKTSCAGSSCRFPPPWSGNVINNAFFFFGFHTRGSTEKWMAI